MNILINFHNKNTAHYEEHSIIVAQLPSFGLRMARKGYKMVLIGYASGAMDSAIPSN